MKLNVCRCELYVGTSYCGNNVECNNTVSIGELIKSAIWSKGFNSRGKTKGWFETIKCDLKGGKLHLWQLKLQAWFCKLATVHRWFFHSLSQIIFTFTCGLSKLTFTLLVLVLLKDGSHHCNDHVLNFIDFVKCFHSFYYWPKIQVVSQS